MTRLDEPPARVAVLRALNGLGDMLCVVPALRALRAGWPEAHVTLVGLPSQAPLAARFSAYLDDLLEFPGFPGIPERPDPVEPLEAFAERARARRFDLALQMQGDGTVINDFLPLLGARRMAGFAIPGAPRPEGAALFPYPGGHEIHRWLTLMEEPRAAAAGRRAGVPGGARRRGGVGGARRRARARARPLRLPARRGGRRAAPLAGGLLRGRGRRADRPRPRGRADRHGGGARGDRGGGPAHGAAARRTSPGRTSLGATARCLADAALLVTNDTGLSHLAAATRTPSVAVFLAADPGRWAPLDRARHRAVLSSSLADRALAGMIVAAQAIPSIDEVSHVISDLVKPKPVLGA